MPVRVATSMDDLYTLQSYYDVPEHERLARTPSVPRRVVELHCMFVDHLIELRDFSMDTLVYLPVGNRYMRRRIFNDFQLRNLMMWMVVAMQSVDQAFSSTAGSDAVRVDRIALLPYALRFKYFVADDDDEVRFGKISQRCMRTYKCFVSIIRAMRKNLQRAQDFHDAHEYRTATSRDRMDRRIRATRDRLDNIETCGNLFMFIAQRNYASRMEDRYHLKQDPHELVLHLASMALN